MIAPPRDPLSAVTHPDPYPYYAALPAFEFMPSIGMWVAAGAKEIREVLASERCRVRPADEPVPRALSGSKAGEIFARLARMRDGDAHRALRTQAIIRLDAIAPLDAAKHARALLDRREVDPEEATAFQFALSARAIGSALGVRDEELSELGEHVADFARMLAPGADGERLEAGKRAALGARVCAMELGLLSQAYDATAGLIGNTLVALGREPEQKDLRAQIDRVLIEDPPVHNTRRFIVDPVPVPVPGPGPDRDLREGDVILLVLAAAARDLAFGAGAHACPGSTFAKTIAEAGVRRLLECGARPDLWARTYRPSLNTRVPLFHHAVASESAACDR